MERKMSFTPSPQTGRICCNAQTLRTVARPDRFRCCEIEARRAMVDANKQRLRRYASQGLDIRRAL